MPIDLNQLEQIFTDAVSKPSLAERAAYLDRACGTSGELRRRVDALLAAHASADTFMALPEAASAAPIELPDDIRGYRILQPIGEGGFGTVYLAEQERPVRRRVALKIIKLGMDTKQVIARFEAERQALAMMDHPNIAKVFDAGASNSGRPYFVMELVSGAPITEYCDKHNLNIVRRLELFVQVCQAVHHAHQKGLIHRDIKPTNILVSTQDDKPFAKVIDFGIAKATQARLTEKTMFTEVRQLIGTPQYMSPEQADASLDIDTRSDLYSLGVLLYELLIGATPFDPRDLRDKAYGEIQRIIREVEPPKPSTRLSALESLPSVAAQRSTEPRKLSASIRGELDWIVMKCLEKDRARRYESAAALARDIEHHLADEPVTASVPSRTYRARKFVRRNKGPVAAAAAILVVLTAGTVGTTIGLIGQARQRAKAELKEQEALGQTAIAQAVARFQADMLASADPDKQLGDRVSVLQVITASEKELDAGKLKDQPLVEAYVRDTIAITFAGLGRYDLAEPNHRRALELRRANLPVTHVDVGTSLNNLGYLLRQVGKFDEAERLIREAVDLRTQTMPPFNREIGIAKQNLAMVLLEKNQVAESEKLFREALDIFQRCGPSENQNAALSISDLGTVLFRQGRYQEAEARMREHLELERKLHPPGHPRIGGAINNLAVVLDVEGKSAEAEVLFRESLEISRKTLPAAHPNIAMNLHNIGSVLQRQGKLDEAEALLREALAMRRAILPAAHGDTALTLNNLGSVLANKHQLAEAESVYREALEINRRILPAGHPEIGWSMLQVAGILCDEGRLDDAEALAREAMGIVRKSLPPVHPELGIALNNVARIERLRGNATEAEPMNREAIAIFEQVYSRNDQHTAMAHAGLGMTLTALKRFTEAESELFVAERMLAPPAQVSDVTRRKFLDGMIELYDAWDHDQPGKGYDQKAREWRSKLPATAPTTTSPASH